LWKISNLGFNGCAAANGPPFVQPHDYNPTGSINPTQNGRLFRKLWGLFSVRNCILFVAARPILPVDPLVKAQFGGGHRVDNICILSRLSED
jgi:hypothetical protein